MIAGLIGHPLRCLAETSAIAALMCAYGSVGWVDEGSVNRVYGVTRNVTQIGL